MRVSTIGRTLFCLIFLHDSLNASAGIDWSRYDDGPVFFLGWETSFYFAIGAAILYGLSWLLSENNKDEKCRYDNLCYLLILSTYPSSHNIYFDKKY